MDGVFDAYLAEPIEPDDIPLTKKPVWILGKKYNALEELSKIRQDITSRIWCTYRKGFVPIGGSDGLTSDKGWGCMLRCGQMVLAQALISLHLGRDWFWEPDIKDSIYLKILQKFEDRRQAPFSIHQIAVMGASEGKDVGQWFGPNTVAQVLKKLVRYDEWSSLVIHVALDNTVVISEIKNLCIPTNEAGCSSGDNISFFKPSWKPLLLVVPLRLGLSEINPIYVNCVQACFQFEQSLGIIGGKPNLALYFIGCVGDEVIFLDPHTTQRAGFVENKETDDQIELDATYHCKAASRINILSMDPSVAVCFFCKTEEEFNQLCDLVKTKLLTPDNQPLFEVCLEKPKEWVLSEESMEESLGAACCLDYDAESWQYDSENEFEIL